MTSVVGFSSSQRRDQFIQLVRDGLHLGLRRRVADGQAESGNAVAVGAGAADGVAQVHAGDFAGIALRALRTLRAIAPGVSLRASSALLALRALLAYPALGGRRRCAERTR